MKRITDQRSVRPSPPTEDPPEVLRRLARAWLAELLRKGSHASGEVGFGTKKWMREKPPPPAG
jgi:hypothetical protein